MAAGVKKRLSSALRPRTDRCYSMLFWSFVAFCVSAELNIFKLNQVHVLSYLEYLATHGVYVRMLANHIFACKAKLTVYGLQFHLWDHPNVRYLLKYVIIKKPIVVTKNHIIDLAVLNDIVVQCDNMYLGRIFKAVFC